MGLFKKKDKVIDLTSYYEKNKEKFDKQKTRESKPEYEDLSVSLGSSKQLTKPETSSGSGSSSGGFFGSFFGGGSSNSNSSSSYQQETNSGFHNSESVNPDERKRKLAKRLSDMTSKIEDLSNQIYHLQQRLELVERKLDVNRF
jgi:hypothetical protein